MAKISARGAKEIARYRNDTGSEYVLRTDGALLQKLKGGTWRRTPLKLANPNDRTALGAKLAKMGYREV